MPEKRHKEVTLSGIRNVLYFDLGGGYIDVDICKNVYLRFTHFTVYKLHLNKRK